MPSITTLPCTVAALPSLALCPPRHRQRPPLVRPCAPTRGHPLLHPPILSRKMEPLERIPGINKAPSLLLQGGALVASVAQPVLAVTGNNNNFDDDPTSLLIQAAIAAVGYFLVMPAEVVQAQVLRDVPAVHVCVHLLSRIAAVGTIFELQTIPKGSHYEIPLVHT